MPRTHPPVRDATATELRLVDIPLREVVELVRIDLPGFVAAWICQKEGGIRVFVAQLHVPGKAVTFLCPVYISRIEVMAQWYQELACQIQAQQHDGGILSRLKLPIGLRLLMIRLMSFVFSNNPPPSDKTPWPIWRKEECCRCDREPRKHTDIKCLGICQVKQDRYSKCKGTCFSQQDKGYNQQVKQKTAVAEQLHRPLPVNEWPNEWIIVVTCQPHAYGLAVQPVSIQLG